VQQIRFFSDAAGLLAVGLLFIAALGIRIYALKTPPLEFHATREYRYALVAHDYFLSNRDSIPAWEKQVAYLNHQDLASMEPPIVAFIAGIGYRMVGAEQLWIPRLMSSLFWLIGGVFLYLVARRAFDRDGALISAAYYLFLPYGIFASRSFQPDPLMIMLMLWSIYAIVQYFEPVTESSAFADSPINTSSFSWKALPSLSQLLADRSLRRLIAAALISSIAILVKPVCLFLIVGAFLALSIYHSGIRRTIVNGRTLIFGIITGFPVVFYYFVGILLKPALHTQAEISFVPGLLLQLSFWRDWFIMARSVIGDVALIGGLIGVLIVRNSWQKALLVGLWIGYAIFGLVFTYHIHTHDYYQLPLIVVVALSLGALGALVMERLGQACTAWYWRVPVYLVLLLPLLLSIDAYTQARRQLPDFDKEVQVAEQIGEVVGHSANTIILSGHYGRPIRYHGELFGITWLLSHEIDAEANSTQPETSVSERFDTLMQDHHPEYFIVADIQDFNMQQDLKQLLTSNFPVFARTSDYIIFDLRKKIRSSSDL